MARWTLVIADAQPVVRAGMSAMLQRDQQFEVAVQASDGPETVTLCRRIRPDGLLLGMDLPRLSGLGVLRNLQASGTAPRTLVFGRHADAGSVHAALELGAAGYALTTASEADLLAAIRRMMMGQRVLVGLEWVLQEATEPLLPQELVILRHVARGMPNKLIARELGISVRTVTTHLTNVYAKLGADNRTAAVLHARHLGYLTIE